MTDFSRYTDAVLSSLKSNSREQELVAKKQEILEGIYNFYNLRPDSILFVGFNPAVLNTNVSKVFVTEISESARQFLTSRKVNYTYIAESDLAQYRKSFDVVVAVDEYFTFANTDQEQIDSVSKICSLAREFVISTLRDYKNQDYKDREFSIPAVTRSSDDFKIYTEFHNWNNQVRTNWTSKLFEIDNDQLEVYGPFDRHTMYFKQLAKFSLDAGADDFVVHKNLMYKSPVKKNYEHVISIRRSEEHTSELQSH